MQNRALIEKFYSSFATLDADAMKACYAPNARFDDEVFSLRGRDEVASMWQMLCDNVKAHGRDAWKLEYSGVEATNSTGRALWEAHYQFSATRRLVHNVIEAEFTFEDGLIATHRDTFDFWKWSRQALGPAGTLLGWTTFLKNKVRTQAAANLATYRSKTAR